MRRYDDLYKINIAYHGMELTKTESVSNFFYIDGELVTDKVRSTIEVSLYYL